MIFFLLYISLITHLGQFSVEATGVADQPSFQIAAPCRCLDCTAAEALLKLVSCDLSTEKSDLPSVQIGEPNSSSCLFDFSLQVLKL